MTQTDALEAAVIGVATAARQGPQVFVVAFLIAVIAVVAAVTAIAFIAPNHRVRGDKS